MTGMLNSMPSPAGGFSTCFCGKNTLVVEGMVKAVTDGEEDEHARSAEEEEGADGGNSSTPNTSSNVKGIVDAAAARVSADTVGACLCGLSFITSLK